MDDLEYNADMGQPCTDPRSLACSRILTLPAEVVGMLLDSIVGESANALSNEILKRHEVDPWRTVLRLRETCQQLCRTVDHHVICWPRFRTFRIHPHGRALPLPDSELAHNITKAATTLGIVLTDESPLTIDFPRTMLDQLRSVSITNFGPLSCFSRMSDCYGLFEEATKVTEAIIDTRNTTGNDIPRGTMRREALSPVSLPDELPNSLKYLTNLDSIVRLLSDKEQRLALSPLATWGTLEAPKRYTIVCESVWKPDILYAAFQNELDRLLSNETFTMTILVNRDQPGLWESLLTADVKTYMQELLEERCPNDRCRRVIGQFGDWSDRSWLHEIYHERPSLSGSYTAKSLCPF